MPNNFRCRCLTLLVYEDSTNIEDLVSKLTTYCDFVYICHDKDNNEDGEIKKKHYHFILKFNNAKWLSSVSKELGISENYFQQVRNTKNAYQYLIHFNDLNKFQYSTDELFGPLKSSVLKALKEDSVDEETAISDIFDYINNSQYLTISQLSKYCISSGYWQFYRRSFSILFNIIREHNENYL